VARISGSQGSGWLIHAGFDLGRGGFSRLELTGKHGAESIERGATKPGEVRIGDRNFANGQYTARVPRAKPEPGGLQRAGMLEGLLAVWCRRIRVRPDRALAGHAA